MNKLTKVTNKIMAKVPANNVTRAVGKAGLQVQKNSPLILTVTGGLGLIATAYFAYKAQPRIQEIVEDMEAQRELIERYQSLKVQPVSSLTDEQVVWIVDTEQNGVPTFDRAAYLRDILGAVALPVVTGVVSLTAMAYSYRIMNGRIKGLAGALSSVVAQKMEQEARIKKYTTPEQYEEITGAATLGDIEVGEGENKSVVKGVVERRSRSHEGVWFSESQEFAKDDDAYNKQWLYTAERVLDQRLQRRGHLFLNEVYDELGLPREEEGMVLGWNYGDPFGFGVDTYDAVDIDGTHYKDLYINWVRPRSIYEDVDFTGRYGMTGGY